MSHIPLIKIVLPATPGLLTRMELADYLGIDDDRIADIAQRFGLATVEGHFPEPVVWRQILGLAADDAETADLLRQQLQDTTWVARSIGRRPSTIRNRIRAGTFEYSCGTQLGEVAAGKASPRLRRFIPALIQAQRAGAPAPGFRRIVPVAAPPADGTVLPASAPAPSQGDALAATVAADAGALDNILEQILRDIAA